MSEYYLEEAKASARRLVRDIESLSNDSPESSALEQALIKAREASFWLDTAAIRNKSSEW